MKRCLITVLLLASLMVRGEGHVVINEAQSSNGDTLTDQLGENSDWIELYNGGDAAVDLSGWGLSDKKKKPYKWTFPAGTMIAAGAYLVVIADEEDKVVNGEIHAGIALSAKGEDVYLTRPEAEAPEGPEDSFSFGKMPQDASAGRGSAGGVVYFLTPTPGRANEGTEYGPPCEDVTFSVARGYYDEPIALVLSNVDEKAEIRYTLDHSRPTATNGMVFDPTGEPIRIETTTTVRAVAVKPDALPLPACTTHTYVFPAQVADQKKPAIAPTVWTDTKYLDTVPASTPASYGPSATVLKDDASRAQFVAALRELPVLAITMSDAEMFDPDTGTCTKPVKMKGTERQASFEWMNASDVFGVDAGFEVHGASSPHFDVTPKKSFRVSFKGRYGTSSLEDHPIMAEDGCARTKFKKLVLRGENNYSWHGGNGSAHSTSFKDQLFRDLQQEMSGFSLGGTFAHLFLNGLYWGIYNVTEHANSDWSAEVFGGNEKDWTTAKFHEISDGDGVAYNAIMDKAARFTKDFYRPSVYASACASVDIGSFIDYMILEYWSGNTDWPNNNVVCVGAVEAGQPFRFLVWDAEFGLEDMNANTLGKYSSIYGAQLLQRALTNNVEYCRRFAQRVDEVFAEGGPLSLASVSNHVDRLAKRLRPAIFAEAARWGSYAHDHRSAALPVYGISHWEAAVARLEITAPAARTPIFLVQLKETRYSPETMPSEDEIVTHTPTPPPTPPPPPPPPPTNHVVWTAPAEYVPKDDVPWVAGFTCEGERLTVKVKGLKPGERCGVKVVESLAELSAASANVSTAEGDEATFELAVPERVDSLFIQVLTGE